MNPKWGEWGSQMPFWMWDPYTGTTSSLYDPHLTVDAVKIVDRTHENDDKGTAGAAAQSRGNITQVAKEEGEARQPEREIKGKLWLPDTPGGPGTSWSNEKRDKHPRRRRKRDG